jgi:NTE family protein
MHKRACRLALSTAMALGGLATAHADDGVICGEREPGDTRPRIGLALGGGGARGMAHISVIEGIEQAGIRVDCIAGTSMGSLVGALYASGMPLPEIRKTVLSLDWKRMFDDSLDRAERSFRRKEEDRLTLSTVGVGIQKKGLAIATGVLAGQRILMLFERLTLHVSAVSDFDDLPIPYRAIATDLNTGEAVVLDHGNLALAMRASMSLPAIFNPTAIDGRVLLDGGLVNQVPVDVVRDMGADIVIAVDVGTPLIELGADASLVAVLNQMTGMMTVGNTRAQMRTLKGLDLLITPQLGDEVTSGSFEKGERALAIGAEAVAGAREELAAIATAAGGPQAAVVHAPMAAPPVVEFVRLNNKTSYDDAVILERLDIEVGEPLDVDDLEYQLQHIYGIETFALVQYEVVEEDGHAGVVVHALPKSHGPNYLQLGLRLSSDFEGEFGADLRTAVLFAPISRYGAEARLLAQIGSEPAIGGEYYYPLDPRNHNVLAARVGLESRDINVFDDDGNKIAEYDAAQFSVQAGWVREFGNYGAASLGLRRATGEADVQIGDPSLPDFDFDIGEVALVLTLDRLDNAYFPRDGYYARAGYLASRDALGADTDFEQADFDALVAHRFDRHSIQGGGSYHSTIDGVAPLQSLYRLGGRARLVGFRPNELTGQHYALLFGGYTYELADVFGRGAFLGSTLEYGNAWQDRDDIGFDDAILNASLYFGFDSWLGPLLLGYGAREGGEGALFLEIGRQF